MEKLIAQYQDQLFRLAYFRLGSVSQAQDVVQDVFVRFFGKQSGDSVPDNPQGYLYRSVLNACNDLSRKKKRISFVEINETVVRMADDDSEEYMADYERIETLMRDLPPEQSEVITMKTIGNMSFVEIASTLCLSVSTVKSRFRYGIDKLRSKIS